MSRRLFIALAALVFVLTLAIKSYAWVQGTAPVVNVQDEVGELLSANGFQISEWSDNPPTLVGTSIGCSVRVALPSYKGDQQDVIRQAGEGAQTLFLFDGDRTQEQPGLTTRIHYYLARLGGAVGLPVTLDPLIAVTALSECMSKVPLDALAALKG